MHFVMFGIFIYFYIILVTAVGLEPLSMMWQTHNT